MQTERLTWMLLSASFYKIFSVSLNLLSVPVCLGCMSDSLQALSAYYFILYSLHHCALLLVLKSDRLNWISFPLFGEHSHHVCGNIPFFAAFLPVSYSEMLKHVHIRMLPRCGSEHNRLWWAANRTIETTVKLNQSYFILMLKVVYDISNVYEFYFHLYTLIITKQNLQLAIVPLFTIPANCVGDVTSRMRRVLISMTTKLNQHHVCS